MTDPFVRERPLPSDLTLRPETPEDDAAIETLYAAAFGPGRHARTASRIREGARHEPRVSFVAERRGHVIGAIRQTPIAIGGAPALMLGPLAVAETAAKQGIGRALLIRSIEAARQTDALAIVLVGDEPFYGPSGFKMVSHGSIAMPGPVERHRLLQLPLRTTLSGLLTPRPT